MRPTTPPFPADMLLGNDTIREVLSIVAADESHEAVGLFEAPLARLTLERIRLHAVLRRDHAELSGQQGPVCRTIGDTIREADAGAPGRDRAEGLGGGGEGN